GENRIFVKAGLPRVSKTENLGLEALMEVSNIAGKKFKPYHAGYILGPRINASGRMGSAQKSLDLLLSEDQEQAILLAEELNTINAARQKLQKDVVQEALNLVDSEVNFGEHKVIVVSKEGWHKGVLGIAASRLAETFYRPTIIISLEDGVGTASARSIKGFHLNKALAHCSDILESFGGHKLAAGLTIREEKIKEFTKLINNFAHDILEAESLYPSIDIDAEVSLFDLSLDLVDELDKLEPYGEGNRAPIFCTRNLTLKSKPAALKRETLKFWVSDGQISVSAVGFGKAKYCEYLRFGQKVDLAYELCIDDWNKAPAIQLKLKDIKLVSD
ncbi:MAG: single-stranded-DNA-specific exonuclease RecJ, partial [Candidatus Heimdallarchaeota archaeon]|nr:single-stranded-DNA-specific exonuclease RecJ [Candidatus Heimdallarchaeota archaeon]